MGRGNIRVNKMNETEFKRIFKNSVKHIGGFAASMGSNLGGGTPDLYCILPIYGPILIEAKYMKDVGEKFNRKINYSPLQNIFMDGANKVHGGAVWGLVGMRHCGELKAFLVPGYVKQLNSEDIQSYRTFIYNSKAKLFDMNGLLLGKKVLYVRGSDATIIS